MHMQGPPIPGMYPGGPPSVLRTNMGVVRLPDATAGLGLPGAFAGRNGVPHPPPQMHPPASKMMTPRDNPVMQQQMKWMRSSDLLSDEIYNFMQKALTCRCLLPPSVPGASWKRGWRQNLLTREMRNAK
ncbi:unnamed protein product [Peronospora destructor]|uniref:Uncharacterized protein n=1 Tax=Peronospora destructor TaxID=86335 RepID=A0AAV0V1E2_9STRA|nr:unnamed protein product [Peronospora destructor]